MPKSEHRTNDPDAIAPRDTPEDGEKRHGWWEKSRGDKPPELDHPNMNPDNLGSNDQ